MRSIRLLTSVYAVSLVTLSTLRAQEPPEERLGWTNSTELSFLAAFGNAETETLGFANLLRYSWSTARYSLRVDALRSQNADKAFVRILTPPDDNADVAIEELIVLVQPSKKLDAEKYLVETIYDRELSERTFWNVGFTWDRNEAASIVDRYVTFGGLGHFWVDRDDIRFETTYGLSYTDRTEKIPDPSKDETFPGLRLASSFSMGMGAMTTVGNDWASIFNVADTGDWNFDTTTFFTVTINRHLAFRTSLRWLYNSRPALEAIDVLAILPDGVEIDFGDVEFRKEQLDTVVTTSIVFNF